MKNLILATILAFSASSFAADAPKMDAKMQEMMAKMQAYGTTGPQHAMLADYAGNWKTVSKMWMSEKGKPQESNGTAVLKMVLGGRFLQQEFSGQVMGQQFEGLGFLGYDNVKKEYTSIWLDTMATGIMTGAGTFDEKKKTLNEKGEYTCPVSDSKSKTYRSEWKFVDKNKMVMAMYGTGMDGGTKEYKEMEITYTRAK